MNGLTGEAAFWLPRLAGAAAMAVAFYVAARMAGGLLAGMGRRLALDESLLFLLRRTSNLVLLVVGLITVLGTLGIDVSALVAGLGLTGFALGFALRDTIANLLSGVLILLYRPFGVGAHIRIGAHEGRVVTIDLRYTTLEAGDDRVLIPNSKLFTEAVTILAGQD